jgi:uncharacterized protein (TIGR01777 family)
MNAVFSVLFAQALLGAFDNLWHHELGARLPQRASARLELRLHAAREAIYGALFLGLAWLEFHGAWVLLPATLLAVEVAITIADFLEEDRSRKLPPLERVLHTVLAVSFGLLLGLLAPVFLAWWRQPESLVLVTHGAASWFFTVAGVGVSAWSFRNLLASRSLGLVPSAAGEAPMRLRVRPVLVTGATGFIGAHLVRTLLRQGRGVIVLTRDVQQARRQFGGAVWAIDRLGDIPNETRIDAVVHLAGAPVLGMPWTRARRQALLHSRVGVMEQLLVLMRRLHQPPRVLVAASAVGFYGVPLDGGAVTEDRGPQPERFQSQLCAAAEHAARRAEAVNVRVVRVRFGIVLGHGGGAFPQLDLAARLGLGARLGSGAQPVPWVHLDDAVALLQFALENDALRGPVNCVAPEAVDQRTFAQRMARTHGRRVWLRVPAWMLRTTLREMAEILCDGQNAVPWLALKVGFRFTHPSLDGALAALRATGGRLG